jgi:hypothetical protein
MENLMTEVVLKKINNKISLQILYLKTIQRRYIYSPIEDSEVVLVSERDNAGLKKLSQVLSAFLNTMRLLKYCHVYGVMDSMIGFIGTSLQIQ